MQTRKRQLGSKIDREMGRESLDAKTKYLQNKISAGERDRKSVRSGYAGVKKRTTSARVASGRRKLPSRKKRLKISRARVPIIDPPNRSKV